ncbi:MAG: radical SAM protein, partial [Candidatus Thiodiazotropha endolucinida]
MTTSANRRHPPWLKVRIPGGRGFNRVRSLLDQYGLDTVCQQAKCPNMAECHGNHTATFLIMGRVCTRKCRYCNIDGGEPSPLDPEEPARIAEVVKAIGLKYVVITSVTRDDLP